MRSSAAAIDALGAGVLAVRRRIDPLDDAFRVLGRPDEALPPVTEAWRGSLSARLDGLAAELAAHQSSEPAYGIVAHQIEDARQRLDMELWAVFLSGYDHAPLGRITGLIPSLPTGTREDDIFLLDVIASIGPYLDGCLAASSRAAARNWTPWSASFDRARSRWRALVSARGRSLVPEGASASLAERVTQKFEATAQEAVRRYVDGLDTLFGNTARDGSRPGLCYLPQGEGQYIRLVANHTDGFGTPNEIHKIGLYEIRRMHEELADLAARPSASVAEMLARAVDSPSYGTMEIFASEVMRLIKTVRGALADKIDLSKVGPLLLSPVPAALADASPPAYYIPGGEGHQATLMINGARMASAEIDSAHAMIFHEAIPGHHAQFEIARALPLPNYRRAAWFNAFIEGWGLYCEELAGEAGLYHSTAARRGKLAMELLRAARLVVDTGLHAQGWSVGRAEGYLVTSAGLTAEAAQAEVARYIEYPAQALSYAIGKASILKLRERVRMMEGAAFDLRRFHSALLGQGAAPLNVLSEAVLAGSFTSL